MSLSEDDEEQRARLHDRRAALHIAAEVAIPGEDAAATIARARAFLDYLRPTDQNPRSPGMPSVDGSPKDGQVPVPDAMASAQACGEA